MDPSRLTPGDITPYAEHCFTLGACGALAIAIHDKLGWPIYAVTDAHNVYGDQAGGGSALHWVVKAPNGMFLDIDGYHEEADLIEQYEAEADDGEAGVGRSTRADCGEWYGENQGEPIPISLATTFVDAVIERADEKLATPTT